MLKFLFYLRSRSNINKIVILRSRNNISKTLKFLFYLRSRNEYLKS